MQALRVRFSLCNFLTLMLKTTLTRFFSRRSLTSFPSSRLEFLAFSDNKNFSFYLAIILFAALPMTSGQTLRYRRGQQFNNEIWSTLCQQGLNTMTMATRTLQICINLDFCTLCRPRASSFHFVTFLHRPLWNDGQKWPHLKSCGGRLHRSLKFHFPL